MEKIIIDQYSNIIGSNLELIDSIGIETHGGVYTKLINQGAQNPISISHIFSTVRDNQTAIDLSIYRGDQGLVKDNLALGKYEVIHVPKGPKGVCQIEITFGVSKSDIWMSAKDLSSENYLKILKIE